MKFNNVIGISIVAVGMTLTSFAGAETLRWARSGDSLTLDPHAQNKVRHLHWPIRFMNLFCTGDGRSDNACFGDKLKALENNPNVWRCLAQRGDIP